MLVMTVPILSLETSKRNVEPFFFGGGGQYV